MKIVKETAMYVWSQYTGPGRQVVVRDKKLLCVGGPFAGQKKAAPQLPPDEYSRFNRADRTRGTYFHPPVSMQISQIFLHKSLITS